MRPSAYWLPPRCPNRWSDVAWVLARAPIRVWFLFFWLVIKDRFQQWAGWNREEIDGHYQSLKATRKD